MSEQAIDVLLAQLFAAIKQDWRDADCASAKHIVDIRVADVQRIVGDGVGTLQCLLIELRRGFPETGSSGDDHAVKVLDEVEIAQNRAECYAPIGDDSQRVSVAAECLEGRYYIRE